MEEEIEEYLKDNYKCYDRFTFDKIFRFLLSKDYTHEETKDLILLYCSLSAIIFQERIYNGYYKNISVTEVISEDLQRLKNEIFNYNFKDIN